MVVDGGAQVNDVWEGGPHNGGAAGFSCNGGAVVGAMGAESGKERTGRPVGLALEPRLSEGRGVGAEPCSR